MRLFTFSCLLLLSFSLLAQQEATEATLLGTWENQELEGSTAFNNTYNEIWGLALNGREYAVLGSTAGTHFLDVTNPADIREMFFLPGQDNGPQIIHRDYHNYDCYLYAVADEGQSSLQIIDLSYLPDSISVV